MSEHKRGFSKLVVTLLLLVIAALGVGLYVVLNNDAMSTNNLADRCRTDSIGQEYINKFKDKIGNEAVDTQSIISQIELADPNRRSVNCVYILAKIAHYGGQNERAVQLYDRLLELNQNDSSLWVDESIGRDLPAEITRLRDELKVVVESLQESLPPERYETGLRLNATQ